MKDNKKVFKCAVATGTIIFMAALVSGCGGRNGSEQNEAAIPNQNMEAVSEKVSTEADTKNPETESMKEEPETKSEDVLQTEEAFIAYNEEEADEIDEVYEEEEDGLTQTQRNSIIC